MTTTTYTLISATVGDVVPGFELSSPDSSVGWADLPQTARDWAAGQGYGPDDPAELLYVTGGIVRLDDYPTMVVTV